MTLHTETAYSRKINDISRLLEFLHRFIHAANSHVEREPFIVEGESLIKEITS
ncbi:hypothetical protein LCGC14_2655090 [marine sediment metagenome]|uniref:Uncharacterized protein n=1 Tax=marine sediment metagenome TaxID=412755 RepID=A0A0F9CKN8_9ZZZZ